MTPETPRYQCLCVPCGKTFIGDSKHRRVCQDCDKPTPEEAGFEAAALMNADQNYE